jgi:hypothetical protein
MLQELLVTGWQPKMEFLGNTKKLIKGTTESASDRRNCATKTQPTKYTAKNLLITQTPSEQQDMTRTITFTLQLIDLTNV